MAMSMQSLFIVVCPIFSKRDIASSLAKERYQFLCWTMVFLFLITQL